VVVARAGIERAEGLLRLLLLLLRALPVQLRLDDRLPLQLLLPRQ
jgi:hypothetical protein